MSDRPTLSEQQTAERANAELTKRWPKTEFKIQIEVARLTVHWTDGPAELQVYAAIWGANLLTDEYNRSRHVDGQYTNLTVDTVEMNRTHTKRFEQQTQEARILDPSDSSEIILKNLKRYGGTHIDRKFAQQLRKWADGYQSKIDDKLRDRPTHTNRMARQAASAASDGFKMTGYQTAMRNLADLYDRGEVPHSAKLVRHKWLIENLVDGVGFPKFNGHAPDDYLKITDAGLYSEFVYNEAMTFFKNLKEETKAAQEAKQQQKLVQELAANAQAKIEGFFPTPQHLIEQILDQIDPDWLNQGRILEPSAGDGDIAVALHQRFPLSRLDCVEPSRQLCDTLRKRLARTEDEAPIEIHQSTFEDYEFSIRHMDGERYKLIVANPPFENGLDAEHLQLMYGLLQPGGRIYCVISSGPFQRNDKKARDFREWFDGLPNRKTIISQGQYFNSPQSARRTTGVTSGVVMIEKPAEKAQEGQKKPMSEIGFLKLDSGELHGTATNRYLPAPEVKMIRAFGMYTGSQDARSYWVFQSNVGKFSVIADNVALPIQRASWNIRKPRFSPNEAMEAFHHFLASTYVARNAQPECFEPYDPDGDKWPYAPIHRETRASIQTAPHTLMLLFGNPLDNDETEGFLEWGFVDQQTQVVYRVWVPKDHAKGPYDDTELNFSVGGGIDNRPEFDGEFFLFLVWLREMTGDEFAYEQPEDDSQEHMQEDEGEQMDARTHNLADSGMHWLEDEQALHVYRIDGLWEIYGPHAQEIRGKRSSIKCQHEIHKTKDSNYPVLIFSDEQFEHAKPYFQRWYSHIMYHDGNEDAPREDPGQVCANCHQPLNGTKMRSWVDGSIICQSCYNQLDEQQQANMPEGWDVWLAVKQEDRKKLFLLRTGEMYRTFNADAMTLNQTLEPIGKPFHLHDGGMLSSGNRVSYVEFGEDWLLAYSKYLEFQEVGYTVIDGEDIVMDYTPALHKDHGLNEAQQMVLAACKSLPPNTAATLINISEQVDGSPDDIVLLLDQLADMGYLKKNPYNQYVRV